MRTTRIQYKVKNATNQPKTVNLLQQLCELEHEKHPSQPGIALKVIVTTTAERRFEEYEKLLLLLRFKPIMIAVKHTTNNRQLNFLIQNHKTGLKSHYVPHVNSDGVKLNAFSFDWDPKKWNIADGASEVIFDHQTIIECNLLPLQEFNIFLSVKPQPKIELTHVELADEKNNPIKTYLHHFASPNDTIDNGQKKPCLCKKALTYSKFTNCDGNCTY